MYFQFLEQGRAVLGPVLIVAQEVSISSAGCGHSEDRSTESSPVGTQHWRLWDYLRATSKEPAGHGLHSQRWGGLESPPGFGMHLVCF